MADNITVRIPQALRPQVGEKESLDVAGETVGEVLGRVRGDYPEFGDRLYKEDGQLNRFINVYLNDEDIRFMDGQDTPVSENDEVAIIPAIAGG